MTKAVGGCVLHLQETYEFLMDTMDANKTTVAFPVVARCTSEEEQGDFKGIISRARCAGGVIQRAATKIADSCQCY
jgi:hypothetical protein